MKNNILIPYSNKKVFISLFIGIISTIVGWLISLLNENIPYISFWYKIMGSITFIILITIVMIKISPKTKEIPPFAHTISKEGWEILSIMSTILIIHLALIIPFLITIILLIREPQTTKSVIPLISIIISIAVGLAISFINRKKINGWLDIFAIVGTTVTILGGIGFSLAELLH